MNDRQAQENVRQAGFVGDRRFVHTKQRERKIRKGRMRRERLRMFLRFLFVLGALYLMYFVSTLPQMHLPQNAFNTVNPDVVKIINNKIVPTTRILTVLRGLDVPQKPIYMANTKEIRNSIKELAPVEDVYIRRYAFPARLEIIVKERVPVVIIAPEVDVAPVAYFTQDGKIIGREYMPLNIDTKPLLVLSYGNKGDDYTKWNIERVNELRKLAGYIETYSKEKVEYIDYRNPEDIYVKIPTVNIRVGKPDAQIFDRIARLPSILPQVKLVESEVKYLDLSWEKVNYLKLE